MKLSVSSIKGSLYKLLRSSSTQRCAFSKYQTSELLNCDWHTLLLWQCLIISDRDSQTSKNSIQQARLLNHCSAVQCWKTIQVLSLPYHYRCTLVWVLPRWVLSWYKHCLQNVWLMHWDGDFLSWDSPYQCSFVSLGTALWPRHWFLAQWSNGAGWPLVFGLYVSCCCSPGETWKSQSGWWNF